MTRETSERMALLHHDIFTCKIYSSLSYSLWSAQKEIVILHTVVSGKNNDYSEWGNNFCVAVCTNCIEVIDIYFPEYNVVNFYLFYFSVKVVILFILFYVYIFFISLRFSVAYTDICNFRKTEKKKPEWLISVICRHGNNIKNVFRYCNWQEDRFLKMMTVTELSLEYIICVKFRPSVIHSLGFSHLTCLSLLCTLTTGHNIIF